MLRRPVEESIAVANWNFYNSLIFHDGCVTSVINDNTKFFKINAGYLCPSPRKGKFSRVLCGRVQNVYFLHCLILCVF